MKTTTENPTYTGILTGEQLAQAAKHKLLPILKAGELTGVWSNPRIPKLGDRVQVTFNQLGKGEIIGFFLQEGYLGVIVKPDKRPDWHIKQNGDRRPHYTVFGAEIKFL